MIDDVYALLTWLEDQSLESHKKANRAVSEHGKNGYTQRKETYDRVIHYIKTMGKPTPPYKHENQAGENRW